MPQLARSHPPVPVSGLPSRTAWPRGQEAEAHPVASQESLPGLPLTVLVSPTPALGGAVHSRGEAVQGGFTQEPQPKGSPWRTGQLVTAPVLAGQAAKDADERPRRCPLCRRSCERSVKGDKPPPRTGALIQVGSRAGPVRQPSARESRLGPPRAAPDRGGKGLGGRPVGARPRPGTSGPPASSEETPAVHPWAPQGRGQRPATTTTQGRADPMWVFLSFLLCTRTFQTGGKSKWRPNKEQPEKKTMTPIPFTKRTGYLGTDVTEKMETSWRTAAHGGRRTGPAHRRCGPRGTKAQWPSVAVLHGDLIAIKTPVAFLQKWEGQPSNAYGIAMPPNSQNSHEKARRVCISLFQN